MRSDDQKSRSNSLSDVAALFCLGRPESLRTAGLLYSVSFDRGVFVKPGQVFCLMFYNKH